MSAVLLPLAATGAVDWASFEGLLRRTVDAGLTPAVNMDTGYVQLIDTATRARVLDLAASVCGPGAFVAGAYVEDRPGDALDVDGHVRALEAVAERGGTPVVFPSHGLNGGSEEDWVAAHEEMGRRCDRFIAFELGPMFVPYGRIYSLDAYEALLGVDACIGAKHSSLSRQAEWDRLAVRDRVRPTFLVLTGNDLAIDMICDGSDYLLGLSAFAPDAFAERDRRWAAGDPVVPRAQRPAPVPRVLRLPRSGPRVPPRRGDDAARPRLDHLRPHAARCGAPGRPGGRTGGARRHPRAPGKSAVTGPGAPTATRRPPDRPAPPCPRT